MFRWIERIFRDERTYIVPNAAGVAFGMLFFVLLFSGAALNRPLLQLIGFMIAIPYLSAMVQSNGNVKDLRVRVLRSPLAAAGTRVEVRVLIEQAGKHVSRKVRVGTRGSPETVTVERIAPGEPVEILIPVGIFRRGVHPLPELVITSGYPLGIFHTWKKFRPGFTAWIHPAPSGSLPWRYEEWRNDDSRLEYREHRPVGRGDSPSRIDWKRFARDRKPLFRVYDIDPARKVVLSWDEVRHLPLEDALSQMTRWLLDAERGGIEASVDSPFTRGPVNTLTLENHLKAMAGHGEPG